MLATLLIVFREVIEAGLIVGIVLAATRGVPRRGLWVSYGIGGGLLGACIVAVFANSISAAMEGIGQELFNVGILSAAVLMLIWHNVWMARHGREIAMHMKAVGEAVSTGKRSLAALAAVVGIAVLREGSEIVLFVYGIALSGGESVWSMALGGLIGLALGAALGTITYLGLLHIPSKHLFRITGWMIALLAAGMAAQAAALLQQAGVVEAYGDILWDSSGFIASSSLVGKLLQTLIGYTDHPTELQLMVYLATLAVTFTLMRFFGHASSPRKAAVAATVLLSCFVAAAPANAAYYIYSPRVEKGVFEIESRNAFDYKDDDEDSRQHKVAVGYGLTEWWGVEVYGEWEKEGSDGYDYTATEIENIFQFTDPGEYWLNVGALLAYEFKHTDGNADKIEAGLLLEKQLTQFTHTANLVVEQEVGDNANDNPEWEVAWRTLYMYKPAINPGFEYYGSFNEIGDSGDFDDQSHHFGPVIAGSLVPGVKYDIGWLFGFSDGASDHALKVNLEYEFPL